MSDDNGNIIGIDLGTTNSVAAAFDGGLSNARVLKDSKGYAVQPSVVAFHPNGSVLVGADAKQRKVIDPKNTVYSHKRLIGRTYDSHEVTAAAARMPYVIKEGQNKQPVIATRAGEFAVPEIAAIVLDHMRKLSEAALGAAVDRAVVTVPANFTDAQRSATATAGAIAGITVVRVLNEPTAAALAYGHQKNLDEIIAVYDFGGGTFDISILKLKDTVFEVLATAGDSFLGGDDIDERLVDHMVQLFLRQERVDLRENEISMQRLRAVAEQVKIELSRRTRAVVTVEEIAYGAGGTPLDLKLEITRDEFLQRVADIIESTFPVCREAVQMAGLSPQQIDDVILVGGTTKMPFVRERAASFFGKMPRTDVNPDEAIALGASLQAMSLERILGGKRKPRTTAQGYPTQSPGERPVTRGQFVDSLPSAQPPPIPGSASALGRITKRAATAPPPPPTRTPGPNRTLLGKPPAPRRAGSQPDAGFGDDLTTNIPTEVRTDGEPTNVRADSQATLVEDEIQTRPGPASSGPDQPTAMDLGGAVSGALVGAGVAEAARSRPATAAGATIIDVTPHSLGIGTIAGYCEGIIARNAKVPTETKKVFSTSRDRQDTVRIRVCQGESRRLAENVVLGDLVLDNIAPRPRGETKIEVTFQLDASGILHVRARDSATGREQRANLELAGAQTSEEVAAAQERFRALRQG